jgi:hypothetical protein
MRTLFLFTDRNVSAVKSRCGVLCGVVGVLAAGLLVADSAFGIGPDYQVTQDQFGGGGAFQGAPVGTLNDMVRLQGGTTNNPVPLGSGTVIGVAPDPNAPGVMDVAIITAQHVANQGVTLAQFGVGINTPAPLGYGAWALTLNVAPTFQTFKLLDPVNNPNNLSEDMSIMVAQVTPAALADLPGNVNNRYALSEWNLVKNNAISPVAWPSAIPASSAPTSTVNTAAANVGFSISGGFGIGAQYNGANVPQYTGNQPSSVRRFLNGTVTTTYGASVNNEAGYFEPQVGWPGQAPSAAGGGAALPGDSGSGYLVGGSPTSITITNVDNLNSTNTIPGTITLNNTKNVGATEWGGTSETVGQNDFGVPLVSGQSLDWAQYFAANPYLIPEPSSVALVVLGMAGLFLARRRSGTGIRH